MHLIRWQTDQGSVIFLKTDAAFKHMNAALLFLLKWLLVLFCLSKAQAELNHFVQQGRDLSQTPCTLRAFLRTFTLSWFVLPFPLVPPASALAHPSASHCICILVRITCVLSCQWNTGMLEVKEWTLTFPDVVSDVFVPELFIGYMGTYFSKEIIFLIFCVSGWLFLSTAMTS